jgi:hypothetical protein
MATPPELRAAIEAEIQQSPLQLASVIDPSRFGWGSTAGARRPPLRLAATRAAGEGPQGAPVAYSDQPQAGPGGGACRPAGRPHPALHGEPRPGR